LNISDANPEQVKNEIQFILKDDPYIPGSITNSQFGKIFPHQKLLVKANLKLHDSNAYLGNKQTFHFAPI
jgi:hypothetical protein